MGVACWGRALASFASSSARSLPGRPQLAGTQCMWKEDVNRLPDGHRHRRSLCAAPPCRRLSAARESVHTMMGLVWSSCRSVGCSSAALSAKSSALVLEHGRLAETRTSRTSPVRRWRVAPPLQSSAPSFAEPSDHTQVALSWLGSSRRRSSAAALVVSGGLSRRPRNRYPDVSQSPGRHTPGGYGDG